MRTVSYSEAIREGFAEALKKDKRVFLLGQGLWSPWYVGNTMRDLDTEFGKDRVIDTPVSENAVTGAAVGAAIAGARPVVIHPRMDFMLYAIDPIVNEAAKWRYMFNGQSEAPVTVRAIINRGGEQGAQHSQALHSWFAHIPGLRVVMPHSPKDAKELLLASIFCDDPVVYVDDRWLYDETAEVEANSPILNLADVEPRVVKQGEDITFVSAGYSTKVALDAANELRKHGICAEVVDVRQLSPLNPEPIIASVSKTRRIYAIDGGWSSCGFSAELLAIVAESPAFERLRARPRRFCLPFAPAPSAAAEQEAYYSIKDNVVRSALTDMEN